MTEAAELSQVAATPANTRRDRLDHLAIGLLLGCCMLWGLQQIVVKVTLPMMPPIAQAALRSVIAAVLVWVWASSRGHKLFAADRTFWPSLVAGLLFALEFACVYVGLQHTTASRLVVLQYLAPFVVAAGMPFISRHEALGKAQIAGLVLGFMAVLLAFADRSLFVIGGSPTWLGDGLALLAAVFWGLTTLVIRATSLGSAPPEKTLFYQLAVSAVVLAAVSPLAGESWAFTWSPALVGSVAMQSVVVAFASYLVWFWLIRHYPATQLSSFTFLTPLFGLLFGGALLGEPISGHLLAALVGVAVGIWLVNRR